MRVYINNRDLVTWPKKMAEKLAGQGHDVIFYDNASTYEPLLEFYENCPYQVVRSKENVGHLAVWRSGLLDGYKDPYVVTDPDLDIDGVPDDWPDKLLYGCKIHGYKCGLGFIISDLANVQKRQFFLEEKESWTVIEDGYLDCKKDTTFAVYTCNDERFKVDVVGGISTDAPYVTRHLPWHLELPFVRKKDPHAYTVDFNDEMRHYFQNAKKMYFTALAQRGSHIPRLIREREVMLLI